VLKVISSWRQNVNCSDPVAKSWISSILYGLSSHASSSMQL